MPGDEYQTIIQSYSSDTDRLAKKYAELDRSAMFPLLSEVLPASGGHILEVGAGSGIDSFKFALDGFEVTAVEPSDLIDVARSDHQHALIHWVRDSLPDLEALMGKEGTFDLVFLNRVFMHVLPADQPRALKRLIAMLKPRGSLYMVTRHGPSSDDRIMYAVDLMVLEQVVRDAQCIYRLIDMIPDYAGRPDVSWSIVLITG